MESTITVEQVLSMQKPSDKFYTRIEENIFGIRFKGFRLRDMDTQEIYHEFETDNVFELDYFADHELRYDFPYKILKAKTIGSSLTLVVGEQLVKNLELIERHYIDNKLVASYDHKFPVFLPNSENNIEFIYDVPKVSEDTNEKMKKEEPIYAKSDTFIFVEGKLIIHRRANYNYSAYI